MHPLIQVVWEDIKSKFFLEKSRTNACNVTLHVFKQLIWEDTWRLTLEQSHTNASNLCIQAGNLRIHLRTHSGTKPWTICTILDHLDCSTIAIAVTWIRFCIWVWIWFAAGRWNRKSGNWSVTHENECFVQGFPAMGPFHWKSGQRTKEWKKKQWLCGHITCSVWRSCDSLSQIGSLHSFHIFQDHFERE